MEYNNHSLHNSIVFYSRENTWHKQINIVSVDKHFVSMGNLSCFCCLLFFSIKIDDYSDYPKSLISTIN